MWGQQEIWGWARCQEMRHIGTVKGYWASQGGFKDGGDDRRHMDSLGTPGQPMAVEMLGRPLGQPGDAKRVGVKVQQISQGKQGAQG